LIHAGFKPAKEMGTRSAYFQRELPKGRASRAIQDAAGGALGSPGSITRCYHRCGKIKTLNFKSLRAQKLRETAG